MRNTNILLLLAILLLGFSAIVEPEPIQTQRLEDHYKARNRRGVLSIFKGSSPKPTEDPCYCAKNDQPVCANDRVTYPNPCKFKCAFTNKPKLRIVHQGAC